jgi:Fe-S oxidoreductase
MLPGKGRMPEIEYLALDDELWERLVEMTGGEAALCYQCGTCTAICPWGSVRREPFSVRRFVRLAQLGLNGEDEALWLCTNCAQCAASCPRGVDIPAVLRALRTLAWEQRRIPKGLPSVLWSIYWNNNPWAQPPSQRATWAKNLDIPIFDPSQHEALLYVGCTSSYDRRAQKIARSLAGILRAAGVSFGYLGDDEPCCGEAVLSFGQIPYFEEVAAHATQIFQERGVSKLVAISPHCYHVFKNDYPSSNTEFQPVHYTQFLAQLLGNGRLRFERSLERQVTFQDPCYLGRHNAEYQASRQILEAIPGLELAEMNHCRAESLCCGGGGGRMWLETATGERFSDLRVQEASQTGASILATACPYCLVCLEDSMKAMKMEGLQVMDIAEIAGMAIAS